MRSVQITAALAAVVFGTHTAAAQDYPSKRITFVVGFTPGGSTDIAARLMAEKLTKRLNTSVVVENRDGASGTIAASAVVRAPKDGYTLLFASSTVITVLPATKQQMPFDSRRDLAPVSLVGMVPLVFAVHPSVPALSVKELIALAKGQPGKLNYASFGPGTTTHLAGELFKIMTGSNVVHVPYKGGGAAMPDLLSGRVEMAFHAVLVALPYVRNKKLRALAYTGAERSPLMSEIPTMQEAGMPGFVAGSWVGILAPAGTPANVVNRLSREIAAVVDSPDVQETFISQGLQPSHNTPEEFARFIENEIRQLTDLVKKAGISVD